MKLPNSLIKKVVIEAKAGATPWACEDDAQYLANILDHSVSTLHNERSTTVHPTGDKSKTIQGQLDQIRSAIRNATDLNDLKRMVGPSDDESEKAEQRLKNLDRIYDRCVRDHGHDKNLWPPYEQEIYDRLNKEQAEFEKQYA